MKLLTDYLIPTVNDDPNSGITARIIPEIKIIDSNPFYMPIPGDRGVHHFVLNLVSEFRYNDDDSEEWIPGRSGIFAGYPLRFYYSGYGFPSLENFSEHIYRECRATLSAVPRKFHSYHRFRDRSEIEMSEVWKFLKNQHKDYSKTEDFIRDYDYWHDRLYSTLKWVCYMSGELDWAGAEINIGDRIYEFLDLQD